MMITSPRYNEILKYTENQWFTYYSLGLITKSVYHDVLAILHKGIDTKGYTDDELITYAQKSEAIWGENFNEAIDIELQDMRDRQKEYDELHDFIEIELE